MSWWIIRIGGNCAARVANLEGQVLKTRQAALSPQSVKSVNLARGVNTRPVWRGITLQHWWPANAKIRPLSWIEGNKWDAGDKWIHKLPVTNISSTIFKHQENTNSCQSTWCKKSDLMIDIYNLFFFIPTAVLIKRVYFLLLRQTHGVIW